MMMPSATGATSAEASARRPSNRSGRYRNAVAGKSGAIHATKLTTSASNPSRDRTSKGASAARSSTVAELTTIAPPSAPADVAEAGEDTGEIAIAIPAPSTAPASHTAASTGATRAITSVRGGTGFDSKSSSCRSSRGATSARSSSASPPKNSAA
jgi:hypothetical protein